MNKITLTFIPVFVIGLFAFVLIGQYQKKQNEPVIESTINKDDAILGVESKLVDAIKVTSSIATLDQNPDADSYIEYMYVIENFGDAEVYNLRAQSNLKKTFKSNSFEVLSVSSDFFTVNNSFNGDSNTNMIAADSKLQPNQTGTILLNVKFNSSNESGPFKNEVDVYGDLDGPEDQDNGQTDSEGEEQEEEEDNTNTGGTTGSTGGTTITKPPVWITDFVPETNLEQRQIRLFLANHKGGTIIKEIVEGDVFDYNELPKDLRIIAIFTPGFGGRSIFKVNDGHRYVDHFKEYEYKLPLGYEDYKLELEAFADRTYDNKVGYKIVNFKIINLINTQPEEQPGSTDSSNNGGQNNNGEQVGGGQIVYTTSGSASVIFDLIKRLAGGELKDIGSVSASSSSSESNNYYILGTTSFNSTLQQTGVGVESIGFVGMAALCLVALTNFFGKVLKSKK